VNTSVCEGCDFQNACCALKDQNVFADNALEMLQRNSIGALDPSAAFDGSMPMRPTAEHAEAAA
jgi:hypothetical protein